MSHRPLGSILLALGCITEQQLYEALQTQRQQADVHGWQPLGEILVMSHCITSHDLKLALDQQAHEISLEFTGMRSPGKLEAGLRRSVDVLGAIAGLGCLGIMMPGIAAAMWLESPGPILIPQPCMGARGKQFQLWRFRRTRLEGTRSGATFQDGELTPDGPVPMTGVAQMLHRLHLDILPQFWNVLTGSMSLFGPCPSSIQEVKFYTSEDWRRLAVKPGITGLLQGDRQRQRIDFRNAVEIPLAPMKNRQTSTTAVPEVQVLNVPIDNLSMRELLGQLKSGLVLTPNVDHLMKLQVDDGFCQTYAMADYRVCDSQVLLYAARFLGTPLKEKISGSDLFPAFYNYHRDNPDITIFLLGGAEGVAARAMERINRKVGRKIVIAAHSPSFGFEKNEEECQDLVDRINRSGATVLAVGVGAPKQEKWLCKYRDQFTTAKILLAVGATIDFEAGVLKRAPQWVSQIGMEWLFRIACDPKRLWKRYIQDDFPFFLLLLKQKLGMYTPPRLKTVIPSRPLPSSIVSHFSIKKTLDPQTR